MDLDRHVSVLWKRRAIVIGGLVLGIVTAVLAAYQPTGGGLERRGSEQWSSKSMIFATPKGFPWGRVSPPTVDEFGGVPIPEASDGAAGSADELAITPLDPARLTNLAQVYAVMASSDRVRRRLPGHPDAEQIEAFPIDPTGSGEPVLPMVEMTTTAESGPAARQLNQQTIEALQRILLSEQRENGIADSDRVELQVLRQPAAPELVSGPSLVGSILAFVLCFGGAIALAHLIENLSMGQAQRGGRVGAERTAFPGDLELISDHLPNGDLASGSPGSPRAASRGSRIGTYRDRLRDG